MAYTLYTDKAETFECEVAVKNASLKDAFARLIVESGDLTLMFPGELKDGTCRVPIKRLKGLLDENAKGKVHLEVIVEDTYFKPWEDDFQIEQHTSVKVALKEQMKPTKPTVAVSVKGTTAPKLSDPAKDIVFICEKLGIKKVDIKKRKSEFKQVVTEYFKSSPEYLAESKKYITEAISALK